MPGLLDDFAAWWDNRRRVGAANVRGLLGDDPMATVNMLAASTGEDMTRFARDQVYNSGALRSVMPEVRDQAGQQMSGGLLGMTAYHGSPHLFDKFDMSKIGTGEGAQAYGHGLYFAENPGVAQNYRDMLSTMKSVTYDGKMPQSNAEQAATNVLAHYGWDKEKALASLQNIPVKYTGVNAERQVFEDEWNAKLRDAVSRFDGKNKGALYKVDIPDEAVGKMLDWDKPLSQQPAAVRDGLRKFSDEYGLVDPTPGMTGKQYYQALESYTAATSAEGVKRNVSQDVSGLLKQYGIPGIRYLDAGSRGKGGTSNFVLFDDSLAKILSRE